MGQEMGEAEAVNQVNSLRVPAVDVQAAVSCSAWEGAESARALPATR